MVIILKAQIDLEYPKVRVEKKNIALAKKILTNFAGAISEDTSVHTYIFQALLFHEWPDIAKTLKKIAIVEMHHLELLGEVITQLGVAPMFLSVEKNGALKWFSGQFVSYDKTLKEAILNDLWMEEQAIQNYEKLISEINDETIIYLIKRIILDERLHCKIFQQILKDLEDI